VELRPWPSGCRRWGAGAAFVAGHERGEAL